MKSIKSLAWAFGYAVGMSLAGSLVLAIETLAQVIPDDTLGSESSVVVPFNETIDEISGGAIREQNLFHSFEEFSIYEGSRIAFVADPAVVENIFARVTGSEESTISGILGTAQITSNGGRVPAADVDLYLINPNGVIFGENAVLAVGGSFAATTANSVQFGTDVFSATSPEIPASTLTIDPSTYLFTQSTPADIESRSVVSGFLGADFLGLRVPNRENLTFVGGDVTINGGNSLAGLHAFGGQVELAAIGGKGEVNIDPNGGLSFSETALGGTVLLTDQAQLDVSFDGGGDLSIIASDINIENASLLNAGISQGLGTEESQAGDIVLSAIQEVAVGSSSRIGNDVDPSAVGSAGGIIINSSVLRVIGNSDISSSTFGEGSAGNITIEASNGRVVFDNGYAFSDVQEGAIGAGGEISITAGSLEVIGGGQLQTDTSGEGSAGNITIEASNGRVVFDNGYAFSDVQEGAIGAGGEISITAGSLEVIGGGQLQTDTSGEGSAGNIFIEVPDGRVTFSGSNFNGDASGAFSNISASAEVPIDATNIQQGIIRIAANELAVTDGATLRADTSGSLDASSIQIAANRLEVSDGGNLRTDTSGSGNAGNITIEAAEGRVVFNNGDAFSDVQEDAVGEGGNISITAGSLEVIGGGQLQTDTSGRGSAGNIFIEVPDGQVVFSGSNSDGNSSGAFSDVEEEAIGEGGNINITASSLEVLSEGRLQTSTLGKGKAGDITIDALSVVFDSGDAFSSVGLGSNEEGGTIEITTNNLEVLNGAQFVSSTFGEGDAGNVSIISNGSVVFDGESDDGLFQSAIFSSAESGSDGNSGNIEIAANRLEVLNGARLSSRALGQGDAGIILLDLKEELSANNGTIETSSASSSGGQVLVVADSIILEGDSDIVTSVLNGSGSGGDIRISGNFVIALDDSDITASADANADGSRGGDIDFNVRGFFGENFTTNSLTADPNTLEDNDRADVNATGTTNGVVTLPDISFIENSVSDLSDTIISPDQILIASCISRTNEGEGTFNVTGSGGLPASPNSDVLSAYPTSDIQSPTIANTPTQWQLGDPINEATSIHKLANGRLTLSQDCS